MKHRKKFIVIDDALQYKRCRVQLYAQGVVLRDTVSGATIRTKQQQVCQTNDFIVAEMDAKFGGYGIIKDDLEGAIVSSHYFLFEIETDNLLPEYLEFLCKTDIIQSQIKATGSTNYAAIRPYHILEVEIPLPDLDTQKTIVDRLHQLQSLHAQANAVLARLQSDVKRLRQSILQQAIQGKLVDNTLPPGEKTGAELLADIRAEKERRAREQGKKPDKPLPPVTEAEMPFELPEGWVWCRLGEVAYIASGSTPSQDHFIEKGGVPYLKVYNIVKQAINFHYKSQFIPIQIHSVQLKRSIVLPGDILMNIVGPPLGKLAIVPNDFPEWNINQAIVLIRPHFQDINKWIYWFLNEMTAINSIATKGVAGQANISLTQSKNILLPLPPLTILRILVNKIDGYVMLLEKISQRIEKSNIEFSRLWQSEMQQIFKFETSSTE